MFLNYLNYKKKIQLLLLPVFAIMAIGLVTVYEISVGSLQREHRERLVKTAQLTENNLKLTGKEMVKIVGLLQANRTLIEYLYISSVLGGDRGPLRDILKPILTSLEIDYIQVYDSMGKTVVELDIMTTPDADEDFLIKPFPEKVKYGFIKAHDSIRTTAIGPLRAPAGTIGYIAVGKYLNDSYLKMLKDVGGNEIFVVKDGQILSSTTGEKTVSYSHFNSHTKIAGNVYSVHKLPIKDMREENLGTIIIAHSDKTLEDVLSRLKKYMLGMFYAAALLSLCLSILFIKTLAAPLKRIVSFIGNVSKGRFEDELDVKGNDEIAILARNLNDMQKQLKTNRDLTEQYTDRLQEAVKERTRELETLQKQLLQSQKMEAIGQLAGGVAHDFNNLLTAIIGYGNLLHMGMDEKDPSKAYVDTILLAAEKAANLTHSLLAFSRKQALDTKPVNLNEIIIHMQKLLVRLIREDIELKTELSDKALTVMADRGQIEQVLMNLAANARDAMPQSGLLSITTDIASFDSTNTGKKDYVRPGRYALLSVADTGIGIDKDTAEKIFEPFFTTKEVGKGTGLGLSMVYGIIKQHNGYINIYSEPGKGTVFRIYLPMTGTEAQEAMTAAISRPQGGSETILVAEDEPYVRMFIKEILEEFGYNVIIAKDGEEASALFSESKDKISLVLSDVIMPRKNGWDLYMEIKKTKPDLKIIFMSGYTADIINKDGMLFKELPLLLKPVSPHELLNKARQVLDNNK